MASFSVIASPAKKESVEKIIQLSNMYQLQEASIEHMRPLYVSKFTQIVRDETHWFILSKEDNEVVNKVADLFIQEQRRLLKQPQVINNIIDIYAKNLTEEECQAQINFLSTSEGQSIIRKTPIIMSETAKQMQMDIDQLINSPETQKYLFTQVNLILSSLDKNKE